MSKPQIEPRQLLRDCNITRETTLHRTDEQYTVNPKDAKK